ncbi:MAG TPA: UvrD-helicase domain-containing protein [bacterium]|nr:UvrD-helicase domain-containing protein [bacterium]
MNDNNKKALEDKRDRERISRELNTTMLVEAAAGTGKTTSMMSRMANLVSSGEARVENIAAVTFTRKAAAELRDRFRVELEKRVNDASGRERELLSQALEHIERCYIGTIHSFCARLLRERPIEAGVGISFREIEQEDDNELKQKAWDVFMSSIYTSSDNLYKELIERGIYPETLFETFKILTDYPDVDEWPAGDASKPDFSPALQPVMDYWRRVDALLPMLRGVDFGNDKLMPALFSVHRAISHTDFSDDIQFAALLSRFEKVPTIVQKNWPRGKDQALDEKMAWASISENHAVPLVRQWREYCYPPVMEAVKRAVGTYEKLKAESGGLNFQGLLMKAAALLKNNQDARKYFRERYTRLLVDEFQDTDPVQAQVILYLTADDPAETDWRKCRPSPGSLFVVGDPKQSIYRFRRADIATYNKVKTIIEDTGGIVASMSVGFRTIAPIVDWVNDRFASVFPEKATDYAPQRRDLIVGRTDGSNGTLRGLFKITAPKDFKDQPGGFTDIVQWDADYIARFIRKAIDEKMTVPRTDKEIEKGATPEARPGDFMIITYKKSHLSEYARKLGELGIPHQVTGGAALNEISQLELLYLCLAAATRPDDSVALVAALRSELFGISDAALYDFKKAGNTFDFRRDVKETGLDPKDAEVLRDAFASLRRYEKLLSKMPPAAAAEIAAAELGLVAEACADTAGNINAGSMLKAVELMRAARADNWSAADLVERLGAIISREQTYDGAPAKWHESSVVRVMNLHKAKGLQAPVVFLAGPAGASRHEPSLRIDRSGEGTDGYIVSRGPSRGRGEGIALAAPPEWAEHANEESKYQEAEKDRLMYVAATRAGAMLCISGRPSHDSFNPWSFFKESMKDAAELDDPGPRKAPRVKEIKLSASAAGAAAAEAARRVNACAAPTYRVEAAKTYSATYSPTAAEAAADYLPADRAMEWGTVIHLLLEAAIKNPGDKALRALAVSELEHNEMSADLADEAVELVSSAMKSEIWARAARASRRLVEAPFVVKMSELGTESDSTAKDFLIRGVVDLAFEEPNGWVIVDYKTDDRPGRDLAVLTSKHMPQLKVYARAWSECAGLKVSEIGIFFVNTGSYRSERM